MKWRWIGRERWGEKTANEMKLMTMNEVQSKDKDASKSSRWCWNANKRYQGNAQYTPPTQLNCRVESRRRSVLNSQLAHDDCRRKFGNWTCWEFILSSWVELCCVGGVYAPVGCRDPVYNSAAYGCDWRRKLETGSRLTTGAFTPPTRRNSTSLSTNCSDSSRRAETVAN